MREYHKWESERTNFPTMMNLIDILIGDEPKEGMEELHTVDIPADLSDKFKKHDEEDMKEIMEQSKSSDNSK